MKNDAFYLEIIWKRSELYCTNTSVENNSMMDKMDFVRGMHILFEQFTEDHIY